ncbi:Uncharacterised protein [Vibrio cholerae]|nr:Uncharacterised protein [Vibrio cholerae]CSI36980.1 Uncharacterised protein [Vibrio cholerae]CSI67660.1 Uncharacterised protein [Vibrio cholerae]
MVFEAYRFGGHDFVGIFVFEHAILVNARRVAKRIGSDNRFVALNRHVA